MNKLRAVTATCAAGALLALTAACGGDDDDGGAATTTAAATTAAPTSAASTTEAASTTAAASSTAAPEPASGEPVKVLQIVLDAPELGITLPETQAAVKGRIDRLNQEGGVLGRPIEVDVCAAGFDPNKAAACAQRAVEGGYLAAVGGNFANGGDYHAILAEAGIAELGYVPYDPKDGAAPNGFPLSGGGASGVMAAARRIVDEMQPETVAVMYTDSAGGAASLAYAKQVLDAAGVAVKPVAIPRNQPDLSPVVQSAMDADAIGVFTSGGDLAKILVGLAQAGYENVVTVEGLVLPAIAAALGPALDGVKAASSWATSDMGVEGYEQFLADLRSVDESLPPSSGALEAWAGADLLATAVAQLETVEAPALLELLLTITSYDGGEVMTSINLSEPGTEIPDQPAIRRMTALGCTFQGGVCLADQPVTWFDPLDD